MLAPHEDVAVTLSQLPIARLTALREELHRRGQRKSVTLFRAAPDVLETMQIAEEYGALCEALFLVMAAERRVLNVQRELLRGALDVLSDGRVRTSHMEAMLDASAKRLAEDGFEKRCRKVIHDLQDDPVRAEMLIVLATGVAAADGKITGAEKALLDRFAAELGIGEQRLAEVLHELTSAGKETPAGK